jgi:NADPH-dependent stearoyl-CoA 9-desaturase
VFTNVIGRDHDFGYNLFRFSEDVPWNPTHLAQPLLSPLSGLFFQYSIGAYDLGLLRRALPGRPRVAGATQRPVGELARDLWGFLRKVARQSFVDYALFPVLAGPFAPKVLAGNALANAVRNVWAYVVIYCGHLTEGAASFREEDVAGEDRGGWYARQAMGSSNFEIGRLGHVLSGHLGFQIEHHLFPNVPAWRYPEMAPRVREICERHGLPYRHRPPGHAIRERHAPPRPVRSSREGHPSIRRCGARERVDSRSSTDGLRGLSAAFYP